jgi:hypothetical protein
MKVGKYIPRKFSLRCIVVKRDEEEHVLQARVCEVRVTQEAFSSGSEHAVT